MQLTPQQSRNLFSSRNEMNERRLSNLQRQIARAAIYSLLASEWQQFSRLKTYIEDERHLCRHISCQSTKNYTSSTLCNCYLVAHIYSEHRAQYNATRSLTDGGFGRLDYVLNLSSAVSAVSSRSRHPLKIQRPCTYQE